MRLGIIGTLMIRLSSTVDTFSTSSIDINIFNHPLNKISGLRGIGHVLKYAIKETGHNQTKGE